MTLNAAGMNLETMATTLGLGGVAVGFALKDILSNLVSGVLLLAMRPFEIGDQIAIGDTEGTVENIELRATQIRTYDGRLVLIPNAESSHRASPTIPRHRFAGCRFSFISLTGKTRRGRCR